MINATDSQLKKLPALTAKMGEIVVCGAESRICSVLGSCIGVAIFDLRKKKAAFAHVMLPDARGDKSNLGKYADTAVPELIAQLSKLGCVASSLQAKISGGSRMFGQSLDGAMLDVGGRNAEAVRSQLKLNDIPLLSEDVGGEKGRKVFFYPTVGQYVVSVFGSKEITI